MTANEFRNKLGILIDEFHSSLYKFTSIPNELSFEEWIEQFQYYLDDVKE